MGGSKINNNGESQERRSQEFVLGHVNFEIAK